MLAYPMPVHSWLNAVVLLLLFAFTALAGRLAGNRRSGRIAAVVLAALGVWWLFLDKTMEGGTLVTLWSGHGIVPADLASVGAFAVAIFAWFGRPRR